MATKIHAGTSGYSYKEWRGVFYPEEVHQEQWLSYYASQLPSVEINNTFYRMPRKHVVETWRDSVPASFRFVIKASRRITHQSRLKDAEESTGYLLERAEVLGRKLGALLFQLPPYFQADLERLKKFQDLLPDHVPVAFEFRHESWLQGEVSEALANRGHARVVSHDGEEANLALLSGKLAYLRLRASNYTDSALRRWQEKIAATGAENAFVFFKHEDAGGGPRLAARFLALASNQTANEAANKTAAASLKAAPAAAKKATLKKAAPKKAAQKKAAKDKAAPKKAQISTQPGKAARKAPRPASTRQAAKKPIRKPRSR